MSGLSSTSSALKSHRKVIGAVMLRDMRTRFFNHGIGFLVVCLWPLVHLLILIGIYQFAGRAVPYGSSLNVFLATGLVPTLTFMYVSRYMAYSLVLNAPMMAFPVVRPVDVMVGRASLEIVAAFITVGLTILALLAVGSDPFPFDVVTAASAYAATLLLAVGVGSVVGVLVMMANSVATVYALFLVVIYLSSGTLFLVSSLPYPAAAAVSWNPVLHAVEWMRVAYYPSYPEQVLDRTYLIAFGICSLFLGLGTERLFRRILMD